MLEIIDYLGVSLFQIFLQTIQSIGFIIERTIIEMSFYRIVILSNCHFIEMFLLSKCHFIELYHYQSPTETTEHLTKPHIWSHCTFIDVLKKSHQKPKLQLSIKVYSIIVRLIIFCLIIIGGSGLPKSVWRIDNVKQWFSTCGNCWLTKPNKRQFGASYYSTKMPL